MPVRIIKTAATPRQYIQNVLSGVTIDTVREKLIKDQEKREFKDQGRYVPSSKKARAAFSVLIKLSDIHTIEQDAVAANEMVVKDMVWPRLDIDKLIADGASSGCAFVKNELRKSFAPKPFANTPFARKNYLETVNVILKLIDECYSLDEITNLIKSADFGCFITKMAYVDEDGAFIHDDYTIKRIAQNSGFTVEFVKNYLESANNTDADTDDVLYNAIVKYWYRHFDYHHREIKDRFGIRVFNFIRNFNATEARNFDGGTEEQAQKQREKKLNELKLYDLNLIQGLKDEYELMQKYTDKQIYDKLLSDIKYYNKFRKAYQESTEISPENIANYRKTHLETYAETIAKIELKLNLTLEQRGVDITQKPYISWTPDWSWADKKTIVVKRKSELKADDTVPLAFIKRVNGYITYIDSKYPQYLRKKPNEQVKSFKNVWGFIAKRLNKTISVPIQVIGKSQYFMACLKMKSDYWRQPSEMFARAFECYVFDKLAEKGMENNYLVSGAFFDHPTGLWPQGDERKLFNTMFDKIFSEIKIANDLNSFSPVSDSRANEYIVLSDTDTESTTEDGVIFETESSEIISLSIDNKITNNFNTLKMQITEALEIIQTAMPINADNEALMIMSVLAQEVQNQTANFTDAAKISPIKIDITNLLTEKGITVDRWKAINDGDASYSEAQAVQELAGMLLEMLQAEAEAQAELEMK